MKLSKKSLFAVITIVAIVTSGIAYAAFHVFYEIPNVTVNIAGIGIEVYNWFEGETLGALTTAIDFGLLVSPEKGYSQLIVLAADCNGVDERVTWDSTLDPSVGSIALEIEVARDVTGMGAFEYEWKAAPSYFDMTDHQVIGFRVPLSSVHEGDYGHLRIVLQTVEDATRGDYTFSITFYGDQI